MPHTPVLPPQVTPSAVALSGQPVHAVPGADVVALAVLTGTTSPLLGAGAEEVSALLGVDLLALLEQDANNGEVGRITSLPVAAAASTAPTATDLRWVLLVGVGAGGDDELRRAGAALARATRDRELVATSIAAHTPLSGVGAFVVGAILGGYAFGWRSTPPEHVPATRFVLAGVPAADAELAGVVDRAVALAAATWLARTLASVPSNLKNPAWLAEQARAAAAEAGLTYRVWDERQLAAEGFGGIIGVGRASATPPRLIRLDYAPRSAGRRTPTVVLVGKGITFDSGGLSIKPGEGMVTMKRDMTGGAVVIATLAALRAVDCPVRVVGLIPAAENAVGGDATRPGDVLRHWGGRTSEVTNTDAEGRLVMADALAYAVAELDPVALVDVATLTGAIKVALGQQVAGLFASDDALAGALTRAGAAAGEPMWRMPLAPVYEDKLASKVADADNAGGGPGAITAALFLQHFTGGLPWAHLDIASVGDAPTDSFEWSAGPTGFGARALLTWLGGPDPLAGLG